MGPTIYFRGLYNGIYYMLAPKYEFYNYSDHGKTFNCILIVDYTMFPRYEDPWVFG